MAESEEKLKSLLMRVKEENEEVGLNSILKTRLRSRYLVPSLRGKQKGKGGSNDRFPLLEL